MYLVRKRALGDVLWIEPVIRALAARYRKVTVITRYNDLFQNYPLFNVRFRSSLSFPERVLLRLERVLGTRLCSIDLDGAYEHSPHHHFLEAYQEKAGLPIMKEYPRLYFSDAEKNAAVGIERPFVVLHLESLTDKNYRKVYGIDWPVIVNRLRAEGYHVVQLGQHPEPLADVEHRNTTLREMMVLLSKASFFIGLDSGPSHIAAALGIPSILFFGAVNPSYRHFFGLLKGLILQGPCPYAGCFHEAPDPEKMICRLVGSEGIPVCSEHTTGGVLNAIDRLKKTYVC
jgi:ADP-heptose:LPS heptosyltransferase